MSSTILFSKPSRRSFENGRLFGSAATRSTRGSALKPITADKPKMSTSIRGGRRLPGAVMPRPHSRTRPEVAFHLLSRQRENIQRPSLGGVLRQIRHGVRETERGGGIARVELAAHDRARPAADAAED